MIDLENDHLPGQIWIDLDSANHQPTRLSHGLAAAARMFRCFCNIRVALVEPNPVVAISGEEIT